MPDTILRASADVNGSSPSSTIIHDDEQMLHKLDEFLVKSLCGYQQDPWFDLNGTTPGNFGQRASGTKHNASSTPQKKKHCALVSALIQQIGHAERSPRISRRRLLKACIDGQYHLPPAD
jgi:hypothetical protein